MSWVESKEKKGAETPITAIISHVTLREVLDGESDDGVLLLLRARIEASVGALSMSKRVISLMHKGHVCNAESLAELTLELHGHLDGATASAKLAKCFSVTTEEVNNAFADGIVGIAFKAVSVEEVDTSTNKALEVGEVAINQKIRSISVFQERLHVGLGVKLAFHHLGHPASERVAGGAGCGSEEFHVS
jgi:hypothetical protein